MTEIKQILTYLEQSRLITLKGDNYELSHDSLAKIISGKRSKEEQAVIDTENLIRNKLHASKQVETADYLTAAQIEGIIPLQDKLNLNKEEVAYVQESKDYTIDEAEKEKRRIALIILTFTLTAIVMSFALFVVIYQGHLAKKELDRNKKIVNNMYFYEGSYALCVKKDSAGHLRYGFMDKQGYERIPYDYEEATQFDKYGYARVKMEGDLYLIDTFNNLYPLSESIKGLKNTTLALSLKEQLLDELPKEILENPQLKILYLRGNRLKALPDELKRHKDLDVLDMGFNHLKKVPEVLALMPHIKILDMQYNSLDSFDIPLTDIFKLQLLDLSFNYIDNIPKEIMKLQELRQLDISHNYLSLIDDAIIKIASLEKLNLYNNNLDEIPKELINRPGLQLNTGRNKMRLQRHNTIVYNDRNQNKKNERLKNNSKTENNSENHTSRDNQNNSISNQNSENSNSEFLSEIHNPSSALSEFISCDAVFKTKLITKERITLLTNNLLIKEDENDNWAIKFFSNKKTTLAIISTTNLNITFKKGDRISFQNSSGGYHHLNLITDGKLMIENGKKNSVSKINIKKESLDWLVDNIITGVMFTNSAGDQKSIEFSPETRDNLTIFKGCFSNNLIYGNDKGNRPDYAWINCDEFLAKPNLSKTFPLNNEENYNYSIAIKALYNKTKLTIYYKDEIAPKTDKKDLKNTNVKLMTVDSLYVDCSIESIEYVELGTRKLYKIEVDINNAALFKLAYSKLKTISISYFEEVRTYIRHIPEKYSIKPQHAAECLCRKRKEKEKVLQEFKQLRENQ